MRKEDLQIMQNNGQNSYQIDLKEIFNLSHEQIPIEEIEDMELVPNIESREYGNQIEIVGSLILYGNYRGNKEAGKLQPTEELPESYEESVLFEPLFTDRGPFSPLTKKDQLKHQIPIQITLPREKVRNLEEIYTYVSSFDYELKNPYQIEVIASLVISGLVDKEEEVVEKQEPLQDQFEFVYMSGQNERENMDVFSQPLQGVEEQATSQQKEPANKEESSRDSPLDMPSLQLEPSSPSSENKPKESRMDADSFRFSELAVNEDEKIEAEVKEDIETENESARSSKEELETMTEPTIEPEVQKEVEKERNNVIPLPTLTEPQREDSVEVVQEEALQLPEDQDVKVSITNKRAKKEQDSVASLSTYFARKAVQEVRDEPEEEQKLRSTGEGVDSNEKSATYLANFLENNEEQFTRLKICIIQKDETLDEIAERYSITVDSILRSNDTARNQVTAGQLLYIPVKG